MNNCDGAIDVKTWNEGFRVIGIDEVGRGPVAGPMFVGLVSFEPNQDLSSIGLDDSKNFKGKNGPKKLFQVAEKIKQQAVIWRVFSISAKTIDTSANINIEFDNDTKSNLNEFIELNKLENVKVLFDGNRPIKMEHPQFCEPKLDGKSWNVAAASILAKQHQIQFMEELHLKYPYYKFNSHHGYLTKDHKEAIIKHGMCEEHRSSWINL